MKRIILFATVIFSIASASVYGKAKPKAIDYHQTARTKFIKVEGTTYGYPQKRITVSGSEIDRSALMNPTQV